MNRKYHRLPGSQLLATSLMGLLLSSCGMFGGSSGGDDVAAEITGVDGALVTAADSDLVISSKLALIPPKEGETGLSLAETFEEDQTNVYVEEGSLEALAQAETILCYINQTRFETQVNLGSYTAVVDENLCENSEREDNQGQSLMNMKVLSTRAPNAPLLAYGWINEERDGEEEKIIWQLKIAEGSNTANPLGIFRFVWEFQDSIGTAVGGGLIESYREPGSTTIGLRFYSKDVGGDGSGETAANAVMTLDGVGDITGGKVATLKSWAGQQWEYNASYNVDFNANYLARTGSTSQGEVGGRSETSSGDACIDRGQYNSVVYRYGLYAADGSRKNLNSGFPIEFEDGGEVKQGHASYWGIWTQGDVALTNGDSVTRVDWTDGEKTETPYTVVHSPGKLLKYTKKSITLGELTGTDLRFWDWDENTNQSTTYIVHWNGSSFEKVSSISWGENGEQITEASGTVAIPDWGFNFWVESLSANINVASDAALSDSLTLNFHSHQVVSGSEASNLSLQCFSRCPKTSATNDGSSNWEYLAYANDQQEWDVRVSDGALTTYTFNASDKNLYIGSTAYQSPSSSQGSAWVESGVLVTSTQLGSLSSASISPWELEGRLDEYYRWQSSTDVWGQYYAVKDSSGAIAAFDKPLEFSYTHSTANDYDGNSTYDGQKYRINYGGFGELWGIPWKLFDGESHDRPLFSIASGTTLTDDAGTSYTVKALEVAQRLSAVDDSFCADLDPSSVPELPTEDEMVSFDNGEEPAEEDSPIRVIEGELIE